jgi:hypothetical protein
MARPAALLIPVENDPYATSAVISFCVAKPLPAPIKALV